MMSTIIGGSGRIFFLHVLEHVGVGEMIFTTDRVNWRQLRSSVSLAKHPYGSTSPELNRRLIALSLATRINLAKKRRI